MKAHTLVRNLRKFSTSSSYPAVNPKTIDYKSLGFGYVPTKSTAFVQYNRNGSGKWDDKFTLGEPEVKIHVLSNVLHYGQALFEGLKVFRAKDGKITAFNPLENAKRMEFGAKRLGMADLPNDLFIRGIEEVVKDNAEYVPPYESGGSLYVRPFYFGHGPKLGLGKAPEYTFGVISSPVGLYYPTGLKAVDALVIEKYDRAAPHGIGNIKTAGNYAADILPAAESAAKGYPISLYLDASEHKYIEEFSTSNFAAISKDKKTFITPKSDSILGSITNKMFQQLAERKGLKVERRAVDIAEVEKGAFSEVAAVGTAVICTPIKSITKAGKKMVIGEEYPVLKELYNELRGIQSSDLPDTFGWRHLIKTK